VGQIQDEFDQEKPLVARTSETTWDLDGLLPLHELAELVGEPLEQEAVSTVSGWFTSRVGSFPKPGDTVNLASYQLRVEELEGNRVARLSLTRREQTSELPTGK
jgi:CBS domain containing-hemolysin-like protein